MIEGEVAPAKINLAQDILFRRSDNYHEVAMVMASIDLSDYLTFELIPEDKIIVETSRAFLPDLVAAAAPKRHQAAGNGLLQ